MIKKIKYLYKISIMKIFKKGYLILVILVKNLFLFKTKFNFALPIFLMACILVECQIYFSVSK